MSLGYGQDREKRAYLMDIALVSSSSFSWELSKVSGIEEALLRRRDESGRLPVPEDEGRLTRTGEFGALSRSCWAACSLRMQYGFARCSFVDCVEGGVSTRAEV